MNGSSLYSDPVFGVCVTFAAYAAALLVRRRVPRLHPLITAPVLVYALLQLGRIDYTDYKVGGDMVAFFLGPATVALAIPLYKQAMRLKPVLPSLLLGALVGSALGLAVNALCVIALGGTEELLRSSLPKSVTAAVSVELSRWLGGSPEFTAALTVMTGLFGSVAGPVLLRLAGVHDRVAASIAIGAAAHGIGSAKLLADSQEEGGVSGFSMAACAVFTPVLLLPFHWFIL
ncbi:LrgB family protein [Paenibacillus nasutitermitis]|uniref:Membrane protein n=1 Tax=Paenibacillus nasutitermitis TaxID=1652958 RepID=A0A916Z0K6_9BACL|nr:LrgB family protein [Paenibacillus nasutitermitis]GGD68758.1 membrane protein [Paenibacillus nasutitermitis]